MAVPSERYTPGTGRRKRAVARVFLTPGNGTFSVNRHPVATLDETVLSPVTLTGLTGKLNLSITVAGGGRTAQRAAIRHGIARAIVGWNSDLRKQLRDAGYLTRDPREKERKKPGLKRARRAPQWAKR
jgi:small subunit ribosomal protein S9